jgi:hypothetical protein
LFGWTRLVNDETGYANGQSQRLCCD